MCFVNDDYDWIAEESSRNTSTATAVYACCECGFPINIGEEYELLYLRQYEECHLCYEGECSCDPDKCCQCDPAYFGETSEYTTCLNCTKFLHAVEEAEVESGCHRNEARPHLSQMEFDIRDGGMDEAKKYFKTARRLFPELVSNGYLGRLWKGMWS